MKDPFTPDKDRFLILGSRCSVCGRLVCVGPVGKPHDCLASTLTPPPSPAPRPLLPGWDPTRVTVGEVAHEPFPRAV